MLKKLFFLASICLLPIAKSFSQGEIPVNMYTGTPNVMVDLYTLKDHDLAEPIRLIYDVNDVSLNGAHEFGIGWNLSCNNQQVSREVRGLPDDFKGSGSDLRTGWLYNNNYSTIASFANSSDLSTATCNDESSDYTFLANANWQKDTEPDIFSFSAGEYSGKFVFGNDGAIKLIPYLDIQITPVYANAPSDLTIIKWIITTNTGIIYTLDQTETISRTLSKSNNVSVDKIDQTTMALFEREYQLYKTATTYNSSWKLSTAVSPTGATLTYTYSNDGTKTIIEQKEARIFDAVWNPASPVYRSLFSLMKETLAVSGKSLATISTSVGTSVIFNGTSEITVTDLARTSVPFKKFTLSYLYGFLTSVRESDPISCVQLPPFQMFYNEFDLYPGVPTLQSIPAGGVFFNDHTGGGASQDFWGFYNGADNYTSINGVSTPTMVPTIYVYPDENAYDRYRLYPIPNYSGNQIVLTGDANRMPNEGTMKIGTLQRLVYPEGGEAVLMFEPNMYWDAKAGQDQYAGGLRVSSVTYFDGVNPKANITKTFTYSDAQGHSTGRLVSRPQFAFPVWQMIAPTWSPTGSQPIYTGYTVPFTSMNTLAQKWRGSTVVTSFDISTLERTSGSPVGYAQVKVYRAGAGSAVFDYLVPAKYGDGSTGGNLTDWSPSVTKFARGNCSPMNIIAAGEAGLYALFPNSFYDYERGLLLSKTEYNETGALVRKTDNTYQYIFKSGTQPSLTTALAYDKFPNSDPNQVTFLYGRYQHIGDVAKVLASETVKTYDELNATKFVTEGTSYVYGSPYHKLVSQVNKTVPGGTTYITDLKYTLDYPVTSTVPSDSSLWMIKMLKDASRYAIVIEQVSSLQQAGGARRVMSATLSKYRPFSFNKPLLREVLVFRPSTPVTNFAGSGVTNYAFTHDSRYESVQKVTDYTAYGIATSGIGENRMTSSTLWAYNQRVPVAQVVHARAISVGFSDFETNNEAEFTVANQFNGTGRTGSKAIHPYATLTRTIVKPASATSYLLSFWLKQQTNTSVSMQVSFTDVNNNVLSNPSPVTKTCTLTSNDFQLFTYSFNVSALPSTFKIKVQGQGFTLPTNPLPSNSPLLDDIAFYPDYAAITSSTYDMPFGASSSTDPAGHTMYSVFDGIGRLKWMADQDRNIRQVYTYSFPGQVNSALIANVIEVVGGELTAKDTQFKADPNNCLPGALFAWKFDDVGDFTSPSSSNISPVKNYIDTLQHFVVVRVTHPDLPNPVDGNFSFKPKPQTIPICASGVQTMVSGVVTSSYNCFTNTAGTNWVSFKAQPAEGVTFSSFQWQKRNLGIDPANPNHPYPWANTGTNVIQLPFQKVEVNTPSFEVRCVATLPSGAFMISNPLTVTVQ